MALLHHPEASAQDFSCDPSLEKLGSGPHRYTRRGDRCEGIYEQEVRGTLLWIASLTRSFEDYQPGTGGDLLIEWTSPGTSEVRIQAQGIRHDLFYRMDTARPAASKSYRWPSDLLAAREITRNDLGVLAWTPFTIGGIQRSLYLPVRIRQRKPANAKNVYELVLFPTAELREVYLTVAELGPEGKPRRYLQKRTPLGYQDYPAESPLSIELKRLDQPGIYYLEIGATLVEGGSTAVSAWMYREP